MKRKEKIYGSIVLCIILLIITVIGLMLNDRNNRRMSDEDIFIEKSYYQEDKEAEQTLEGEKSILVEIKGAVKSPDVYSLPEYSIVKELIAAAGGLTTEGDTQRINLAQRLRDGMCIIIPEKNQNVAIGSESIPVGGVIGGENIININTASLEELKKLPSVGDATAQNIIDYREKNGGFKTIEEIKNVSRIGEATFNKLKDKIDVR